MKTVKGLFGSVKSTVTKVSSSSKKAIQLLLLSGFLVSGITPSANASPWYQERDGIFGEIKYIRMCNQPSAMQFKVIAEAGSRNNRVKWVQFNMQSAYALGLNWRGNPIAWTSNYNWKWINTHYNTNSGDRRWYEASSYWILQSSTNHTPVRFSIHVYHTGGKTIDLGKIVDLGEIPVGECRTYNDGVLRYY